MATMERSISANFIAPRAQLVSVRSGRARTRGTARATRRARVGVAVGRSRKMFQNAEPIPARTTGTVNRSG